MQSFRLAKSSYHMFIKDTTSKGREGLGLAQPQLHMFIKEGTHEGTVRLGLTQSLFCMSP